MIASILQKLVKQIAISRVQLNAITTCIFCTLGGAVVLGKQSGISSTLSARLGVTGTQPLCV